MEDTAVHVMVVDDEEAVTNLYATWLETEYQVTATYDGQTALEQIDDDVDIVFLDRQMPGMNGDEVLAHIEDRGLDCRVVMVTAVDPDFDIVEMPFDEYLTKPIAREDLTTAVDEMIHRERYDEQLQEYFAAASKKATLESRKHRAELEHSDGYEEISRRVEELEEDARTTATSVEDPEALFRDFPSG